MCCGNCIQWLIACRDLKWSKIAADSDVLTPTSPYYRLVVAQPHVASCAACACTRYSAYRLLWPSDPRRYCSVFQLSCNLPVCRILAGNWTFRSFVSSPPGCFAPGLFSVALLLIQLLQLLIQLKPKPHHLDVYNDSCHSVHMLCWIKRLLTRGETSRDELMKERNIHKSFSKVF